MEVKRKRFQGVLNILSFNRHFYLFGLLALSLLIACYFYFSWPAFVLWIIIPAFIYGLFMPLIVSAYVYDFSGYYNFDWLRELIKEEAEPSHVANINAGFDETSFILESIFPNAKLSVFDFYNSKRHTEPAIIRARKVSAIYPGTLQIVSNTIPLPDESADIIFLLSAAHEIRNFDEKVNLFKECRRVCGSKGRLIIVEHLRDTPNFLAFTFGFTHFFSRKTWRNALKGAGFLTLKERKFTPFMSVFKCST